jgi:hypothetical protein
MDGTSGTNKWKYCLTTLMVITKSGFGIPVAWIIHSSNSAQTMGKALDALGAVMGAEFRPSVMIIDDAAAEISAVQGSNWYARTGGRRMRGADAYACACRVRAHGCL